MELGLAGKRAIVMAASRGLGYACALNLAREGCHLVICSRNQERINAAADKIRQDTGVRVRTVVADVSRESEVKGLVEACVDQLGGVEIAVHNAGGPHVGNFNNVKNEHFYKAFDQNLMSFTWLVQAVIPVMKKAGYGRILTIASSTIKQPSTDLVLSSVMRTGVLGLVKTLSKELAPDSILVNMVAPGRIATDRVDALDQSIAKRDGKSFEEIREASLARIPMGRLGTPEEFANMVTFLASEAASYVTGTAIQVDGGLIRSFQ